MCELLKINIMRQMFDGQVAHLTSTYKNIDFQSQTKCYTFLSMYEDNVWLG